jgi:biotin synthase
VGGIFGMGERPEHRVEMAVTLRELDVDEVPINFLVSIDGTRLAKVEPMAPLEMLRIVAGYRLFLPRQNIFIAAGRMHLGSLVPLLFSAGASGMMVGDFLTTPNRTVEDDLRMLDDLGLVPMVCGTKARPELARRSEPKRLPVVA